MHFTLFRARNQRVISQLHRDRIRSGGHGLKCERLHETTIGEMAAGEGVSKRLIRALAF